MNGYDASFIFASLYRLSVLEGFSTGESLCYNQRGPTVKMPVAARFLSYPILRRRDSWDPSLMFVLGCGVAITLFGFPLVTRSFGAPVCGRPSVSRYRHHNLQHFFYLIVTFEAYANEICLCRRPFLCV